MLNNQTLVPISCSTGAEQFGSGTQMLCKGLGPQIAPPLTPVRWIYRSHWSRDSGLASYLSGVTWSPNALETTSGGIGHSSYVQKRLLQSSNWRAVSTPNLRRTAVDCDDNPSFFIEKHLLEGTDINPAAHTAIPHRLRYKHARREWQLQRDDLLISNPANLEDRAHDEQFATSTAPKSASPMFEHTSIEEMATVQFKDAFCVDIRRRSCKGVALPFGEN